MSATRLDPSPSWRSRVDHILPTWKGAVFVHGDLVGLKLMLGVFAGFRALDYAATEIGDTPGSAMGLVEQVMPLGAWSALCYFTALLIFTGIASRRHLILWCGFALGAVVYTGLAVGKTLQALDDWPKNGAIHNVGDLPWFISLAGFLIIPMAGAAIWRTWGYTSARLAVGLDAALVVLSLLMWFYPADGIRDIGPVAVLAWLHAVFAIRMNPRPLQTNEGDVEALMVRGERA